MRRSRVRRPRASGTAGGWLVSLLLLLPGCGGFPDPGRTLTVAIDSDPANLDPRLGSDEASRRVNDLLYNGLFRLDESARAVPDLASAVARPDDRTLVVTLRDGVRFHDGTLLDAEDVVATYRSILRDEVPSFRKSDLLSILSVEARDRHTVVIALREPFAPILANLNVPILPAETGGRPFRPIGTGPFLLVRHRRDEDVLLRRFEGHFGGPAGVENLRLRIVPSETGRLLELLKGSADLIVNDLSPDAVERVRRTPGFAVESMPGRNYVYLIFNLRDPLLADRRVRRAIAHAIDRDAIVRHLLRGTATLSTGMLPPHHWAYAPDVPRYPHDPAAARSLLDAAGRPDPDGSGPAVRFRLLYKTSTSEVAQQQAAIVQRHLGEVGIGVDIRAFEWPTFYEDLRTGRFQVAVSMWTEINDPDVFRLRFHSAFVPPRGFNRGGYADAAVDRLIETGSRTLDETARRVIYAEVQRRLAHDLPYIPLWHREVVAARRERVRGFRLTPGADFRALGEAGLVPHAGRAYGSGGADLQQPLDGLDRHRPRAEETRRAAAQVEHGRGGDAGRGAAVQDEIHGVPERRRGLAGAPRRSPSRPIGAGGDQQAARRAGQRRRYGVGGDAHADRPAASQQSGGQIGGGGQDQRQGSGPERRRQPAGRPRELRRAPADGLLIGGDQGQGHGVRPPLGPEHPLDRLRVPRIATQRIEGLGRIDHEAAAPDRGGGAGDQRRIGPPGGVEGEQRRHGVGSRWEAAGVL